MNNGRGRGSRKQQKQQQHQLQNSSQSYSRSKKSLNNTNSTFYSNNYTYNPAGYSSYTTNNNGRSLYNPPLPSSCRVIYGRVEAYTTKRAGSDKKTAYQVGENYAHEMHKLNEAVESMKRERRISGGEVHELLDSGSAAAGAGGRVKEEQQQQQQEGKKSRASTTSGRPRSRSVDGVTFASSPLRPLETLMEHSPLNIFDGTEDDTTKRPLEGILKEPSSNKRSR